MLLRMPDPRNNKGAALQLGSEEQRPESPITRGPILLAARPAACIPPRMVGAVARPVVVAVVPTPFPPTMLLPTPLLLRLCFALLLPVITSLCFMSCRALKVGLGNRPMSTVAMRRLLMNLRLNLGRLTAGAAVATPQLPLLLVVFLLWRPLRRRKVSGTARGTKQTKRRRGLSTRKFGRNWMLHG